MTGNENIESVILVDEQDRETGTMEKIAAHRQGLLHRAFSIFIFNPAGMMLLQKRAGSKYHSGGLWTNACCSHPRPGEGTTAAAARRLVEETALQCELKYIGNFIYKATVGPGMTEHELDHVFTGTTDLIPDLNPDEAEAFKWEDPSIIKSEISDHPEKFTAWFRLAMGRFF